MSYITPRRNLRFDKFAVINGDTALRGSEHFHPWPLNGATVNAGLPLGERQGSGTGVPVFVTRNTRSSIRRNVEQPGIAGTRAYSHKPEDN